MIIDLDSHELSVERNNTDLFDRKYNINDCMIVRKTSAFPFNGIVTTPRHGKAIYKSSSSLIGIQIKKIIDKFILDNYGEINNTDFEKYSQIYTSLHEKFNIVNLNTRDTIHVCINGTVSNHAYGNFDYDFIVMDEFSKHIDNSLVCIRGEDTYFNNDISISKIIISKEKYELLKENPIYKSTLDNLTVFIFDSTKTTMDDACCKALHYLGYDALTMSSNHIQDNNGFGNYDNLMQNKASLMTDFLYNLAKEKKVSTLEHFYSDDHYKESIEMNENGNKNDINNLLYIISKLSKLTEKEKTEFKDELYKYGFVSEYDYDKERKNGFNEILDRLFSHTTFEELVKIINEYNEEFLNSIRTGGEIKKYSDDNYEISR